MKRYFDIALVIVGVVQCAPAQHFSGFLSVGYGMDVSQDVSDTYDALVANTRTFGVPLQTQTKFGRTVLTNASILYNRFESIGLGVSFGYSFSPAYSVYEDDAGTLKLDGSVHTYQIALNARAIPEYYGEFPFILNLKFGVCRTAVSMTQEVRFTNGREANADWNLSTAMEGAFFQATIGTSIKLLGDLSLGVEGGYEYASIKVSNAELDPLGTAPDQLGKQLGPYGFVLLLSVGIEF